MLLSSILDRREDSEAVVVPPARDPIEQQILAAGTLSETQVEAIRGFQRRKGLTFGHAAITLGLVPRESLILALSKHYNYPVLGFGSANARISRELVAGYQPFSAAAEAYRSVRSALVTGSISKGKNAFAVIGARSRVGVTSFAANLALSFAQMAVPTLLVDANLRRPRLTGLFGLDRETEGLVEALNLGATDS
jgi:protein-tyrosine kinase